MKKLAILLIFAAPILFTGCFGEDTELGWNNDTASAGSAVNVKWAEANSTSADNYDQIWTETIAKDSSSELKPVNVLAGRVFSDVDIDGAVTTDVEVTIVTTSNNNMVIAEGSSGRYDIIVNATKRKK